jgi:hypothetical protein
MAKEDKMKVIEALRKVVFNGTVFNNGLIDLNLALQQCTVGDLCADERIVVLTTELVEILQAINTEVN